MSLHWIDLLLAGGLWCCVVVYLGLHRKTVTVRISERLQQVVNQRSSVPSETVDSEAQQRPSWLRMLIDLGNKISLFNVEQRSAMGQLLVHGGWRSPSAASVLIALKLLGGGALALLSLLYSLPAQYDTLTLRSLLLLGCFMLGMIVPEYLLKLQVARRQSEIEHTLPDALDLMVICTNAGYSLGTSLQRSAIELELMSPALADELAVTFSELQLSGDSGNALRGMADRVGTSSMNSLVVTLLQSQQYGTPITQALRQLARTERAARMLRLEEKAAKLSTKITLPMILCILPAVVMVSAGPAILNMMAMFGH